MRSTAVGGRRNEGDPAAVGGKRQHALQHGALGRSNRELDRRRRRRDAAATRQQQQQGGSRQHGPRRGEDEPLADAGAALDHAAGPHCACRVGRGRKRVQRKTEVARRLKARGRALLQAVPDDPVERWRDLRAGFQSLRRIFVQDRRDGFGRTALLKRALTGQHLVEDPAEGEDVGARIDGLTLQLLGRHVAERSQHDASLRPGRGRGEVRKGAGFFLLRQLRQAEVEDLDPPVFRDEEVLGLQIAMHDSLLVCRAEAVGDLKRVVDGLLRREAASCQSRAQRLAFEKLLHDVGRIVVTADVVDGRDVGVVQDARRPSLLLEAAQALGVGRKGRRQDFDRHVAPQPRVPRPVHLPHPARTNRRQDLVGPQTAARGDRHSSITRSPAFARRRASAGRPDRPHLSPSIRYSSERTRDVP